ncbi:MAG: cell division protein FtsZ [Verrucomicrobia bacterium]|nr:MAG: cell division protein FtsZ [Verrucomicrobiota bacterium]PYL95490.1 MAG: cell division protein FtsZ [Verrucomicrobiota bacterium]
MIQLSKNYSLPERQEEPIPIKVVGVGSAGSNALDRVLLDGMDKADLIAINTDVQSLASSVAARKVQLGRSSTHGLGTGGDPELGYQAAIESADEIRQAIAGARMIFICAGLGGGTGSGAAPIVAQLAREAGSLVIAFATLPFSFEGKRRAAQAQDALSRLNEIANAVICFENDRMGDMVAPKAGIHQAFGIADMTISQSVRSIVNLIQRPGLIRIGFDDLFAALRSQNGRCLFGFGESDTDNRAHDALTQALKNPLMDKGRMLSEAAHVLVQVAGGPGMTLSEVEILMRELGRHVRDHTQIVFGTAVDGKMGNRLSVTIISSLASEDSIATQDTSPPPEPFLAPPPAILEQVEEQPPAPPKIDIVPEIESAALPEPAPDDLIAVEPPVAAEAPPPPVPAPSIKKPAPRLIPPKKKPVMEKEAKPPKEKIVQVKQEVLQFEPVTRGRFEKSEPTIVEGQDLDIPTFLRKNIRVK